MSERHHTILWRVIWAVVIVLFAAALGYFAYRFTRYGYTKAQQLVAEGVQAEELQEFTTALKKYDDALALRGIAETSAADAAFGSARIYTQKGQHAEAQNFLRQAVELQPERADYQVALGRSYLVTRNLTEAETILDPLVTAQPDNADALVMRARVYLARQDLKNVQELIDTAITKDPRHPDALLLAAWLEIHDRPERAIDRLTAIGEKGTALLAVAQQIGSGIDNDPYQHVLTAVTLYDMHEYDAVLHETEQALEEDEAYRDCPISSCNYNPRHSRHPFG